MGIVAACLALDSARAEDKPLWELGLGAGALTLPHYRGSDQSNTWLLPVPYVIYRGDLLKSDRQGTRATLFDTERSELNLSFAASAPTDSEDDVARQGMPDLSPTVEIGPVWNYTLLRGEDHKLDFRWPLRAVFTVQASPRHVGWVSSPQVNLDQSLGDWNLGLLAGPLFGDRRYHDYFYTVRDSEATVSRPAYRAGAGYEGWQATAALSRQVGNWWMGAFMRYDQVAGHGVVDSPLVRDRHQFSAGLAFTWIFARSSRLVAEEP
jgi:outer membrane scaffolding protein for murein synthesis (MipA/OmpV family)